MIFLYLLLLHVQHHIFSRNLPLVRCFCFAIYHYLQLSDLHNMPNGMVYCCVSVDMFLKPRYSTFDTWDHYSDLTLIIMIIIIIFNHKIMIDIAY